MEADVGWVKAPYETIGLDHLGTQAPCIEIYSQLLPGITNVTNRGRYYSAFPWLIWSLDRRALANSEAEFVDAYRRSECLLTLISQRHADAEDGSTRHGGGMVGRDALLPALARLSAGEELLLSDYAKLDEGPGRYFKNPLGGLGQYYLGPFQDLGLMDGSNRPWITCSAEHAVPLAEAIDARVDGDLFFRTVRDDRVTLRRLDALSAFCFCHLRDPCRERDLATKLFFGKGADTEGSEERRRTLLLIMDWIRARGDATAETPHVSAFRNDIYALQGDNAAWRPEKSLERTSRGWVTYERNDLLSIAYQQIFFASLLLARDDDYLPASVHDLVARLRSHPCFVEGVRPFQEDTWAAAASQAAAESPEVEKWTDPEHEVPLVHYGLRHFKDHISPEGASSVYRNAVRALMLMSARTTEEDPYQACPLPSNYLSYYPINLKSFPGYVRNTLANLSIVDALGHLIAQCMQTHLKVALRKLSQTSQSTFRILPAEWGLQVQGGQMFPAPTNPRLTQAFQMLADIGLTKNGPAGELRLTADGERIYADGLAH